MPSLTGEEPGAQKGEGMCPKPHSQSMAQGDGKHALLISHLGLRDSRGGGGAGEKRNLVLKRSRANPRPLAASKLSLLPVQLCPW